VEWKEWIGKKVFVKLLSGDCYTGTCLEIDDSFLKLLDKYNNEVTVNISQINKIVEEKNERMEMS